MRTPPRIIVIATSLALSTILHAADGTWTGQAGTWSDASKWDGAPADGATFTAFFTNDFTGNRLITVDSPRTIGNLVFNDTTPTHDLRVGPTGGQVLTLDNGGSKPTITIFEFDQDGTGDSADLECPLSGTNGFRVVRDPVSVAAVPYSTFKLEGNNTALSGTIEVEDGVIMRLNDDRSLGAGGVGNETFIRAGGSLEHTGESYYGEIIHVAGDGDGVRGALTCTNGSQDAYSDVRLDADATCGGNNRWDIPSPSPTPCYATW